MISDFLTKNQASISFREGAIINNSGALIVDDGVFFQGASEEPVNLIVQDTFSGKPLRIAFQDDSLSVVRLIFAGGASGDIEVEITLRPRSKVIMTQMFLQVSNNPAKIGLKATVLEQADLRIDDCILHEGQLHLTDTYQLMGVGANLYHRTLHIASNSDRLTRTQAVFHQAQKTISELENYLIAAQAARLKYDVRGIIEKGNKGSSCNQTNRGLIFGEQAEIEADPNLLIDEYDVFAAHGAAIGQVSEDELFYLQSRGLSELEAKKLILSGYVAPFLKAVADADIEQYINDLIEAKIKGAGIV